jgi:filamentous hemagglutinin
MDAAVTNSGLIAAQGDTTVRAGSLNSTAGSILGAGIKADGTLAAGGNLDVRTTQGLDANGQVLAAGNAGLTGGSVDLSGSQVAAANITATATSGDITTRNATVSTNPGGTLVASAGRDANIIAGLIQSQGSAQVNAARDVNLGTVTQSSSVDATRDERNFSRASQSQEIGSQVNAAGNVTITAGRDLNATAAKVSSDLRATYLGAGNNLNIAAGQSQSSLNTGTFVEGSGGFNSSSTEQRNSGAATNAVGSNIGGNTVTAVAGNDINIKGSNVISDAGTTLAAGRNLSIEAATNTNSQSSFTERKESGALGSDAMFGHQEQSIDQRAQGTTAAASGVGAIQGDVNITAGKQYTQTGSDVLAPQGDINITAQSVEIKEARENTESRVEQKFSQSGLSMDVSSPMVAALQDAQKQIKAMGQTSDGRAKALGAAAAAGNIAKAMDATQGNPASSVDPSTGVLNTPDKTGGVNVSVSIGSSKSESLDEASSDTARMSSVAAGKNVNITATGAGVDSNITIQGSIVKADGNVALTADNQVNLLAAANSRTESSTNSSSSNSVGIGFSLGGQTNGFTINASASKSNGSSNGQETTYTNTQIQAANQVSITSGADTTLKGAVVSRPRRVQVCRRC